jgi:hypothetical protein
MRFLVGSLRVFLSQSYQNASVVHPVSLQMHFTTDLHLMPRLKMCYALSVRFVRTLNARSLMHILVLCRERKFWKGRAMPALNALST